MKTKFILFLLFAASLTGFSQTTLNGNIYGVKPLITESDTTTVKVMARRNSDGRFVAIKASSLGSQGQTVDQDNITIVKNFRFYSCEKEELILDSINALPAFTLNEKQSAIFVGLDYSYDNCYYNAPPILKYKLVNKGKGTYGVGGTQITFNDLELIEKGRATLQDILKLPETVYIDFGVNMQTSVYDTINNANPHFVFDDPYQTGHFTIIQGSDEGGANKYYYLIGYGGEYGPEHNSAGSYSVPQISDRAPDISQPVSSVSAYVTPSDQDYSYITNVGTNTSPVFEVRLKERFPGVLSNGSHPYINYFLSGEPSEKHAVGQNAVDLSVTDGSSPDIYGASGFNSFAAGYNVLASGMHSVSIGSFNKALFGYSGIVGFASQTNATHSWAIGSFLKTQTEGEVVFGVNNTEYVPAGDSNDRLFTVGIGSLLNPIGKDGLILDKKGHLTLPSSEPWMIDAGDGTSVITKDWFNENTTIPSFANLVTNNPIISVSPEVAVQSQSGGNYAGFDLKGAEGVSVLDASQNVTIASVNNAVFVTAANGFGIRCSNNANNNVAYLRTDTGGGTYQFPNASGTFALTSDLPAFVEYPQTTYSQTPVWTGTTAPSGTVTGTWQATKIGKHITGRVTIKYSSNGTALTSVVVPLPSGLPAPADITGFTGASDWLYPATAFLASSSSGGFQSSAARSGIRKTAGVPELIISSVSANYGAIYVNFDYWTN
jgi:hypothetical protein